MVPCGVCQLQTEPVRVITVGGSRTTKFGLVLTSGIVEPCWGSKSGSSVGVCGYCRYWSAWEDPCLPGLPMLRSHVPNIAIVSDTLSTPDNDIGNYSGRHTKQLRKGRKRTDRGKKFAMHHARIDRPQTALHVGLISLNVESTLGVFSM